MTFPATKAQLLASVEGRVVEGWDLPFFLTVALRGGRYAELKGVMADLEGWLERQG